MKPIEFEFASACLLALLPHSTFKTNSKQLDSKRVEGYAFEALVRARNDIACAPGSKSDETHELQARAIYVHPITMRRDASENTGEHTL